MKCPVCTNSLLVMSERQGVEIDYCPQCRGIWLDRGELDKLLERAASSQPAHSNDRRHEPSYSTQSSHGHRRKHSSWLSDIFD